MIKDVDYYKPRIKDLPYTLVNTIEELYKEASSHRFICMSLSELCSALELEYNANSFEADSQKNYININSYLEMLNLKLIPAYVPVDLSFYDKILIAPRPDLNNDEDCAAVKALVKSKKTPTQKDLIHISRMNAKLSNYNVMLRVFEGLFVVSSVKLDPHQRVALNNIISEMELPKEGLAFLRACYTYSSEYRNRHCDYKKTEFCFKPLNEEQQLRVSRYLAIIAAASSYKEPFNLEYPYINELESEYRKLGKRQKINSKAVATTVSELSSKQNYETIKSYNIERLFLDLKVSAYNYLNSMSKNEEDINLEKIITKNSPIKNNPLVTALYSVLGNYITPNIEKLIPNNEDLSLLSFDELTAQRPANKIYATNNKQLSLIYPCIYYKQAKDNLLENSSFQEFKAYLQNATVVSDDKGQDIQTVTTAKTNTNILFFTFFLRLILKNTFIAFDKEEEKQTILELEKEYDSLKRQELLFIRCLHFVLFELCNEKNDEVIKIDNYTLLALFRFPELTNFAIESILYKNSDLETCYKQSKELFSIFIYNEITKDKKNNYRWIKELKGTTPYFIKFIVNIVTDFIDRNNLLNAVSLEESFTLQESVENNSNTIKKSLNNYVLFDEALRQLSGPAYKELQNLITHPIFSNLFAPLLGQTTILNFTKQKILVNEDKASSLFNELNAKSNTIKYLASIEPNTNQTLAKLVTGCLKKVDEQIIKRNLKDLTFTKFSQLCDIFKINYSYLANECIEYYLPKLGLMVVPIDMSLPKEARAKLNFHKILSTNLEQEKLTFEFTNKLCAAQMAFIIFSYIVPVSSAEIRLSRYMNLDPEQNVFAIKFFNTLKQLMRGSKPFDNNYYKILYAEQKNNDNFKLCIKYLKQLAIDEIASNPLKNYLEEKFNEIFALLNIKGTAAPKKDIQNTDTKERQSVGQRPIIKTSLQMSSEHSFFKAKSFDTKQLDTSIIKSKLKESSQIQNVINQIRINEGTIENEDQKDNENSTVFIQNTTSQPVIEVIDEDNYSPIKPSSENAQKLIEAIKSQNSDVIDLNEFAGICMSLKFMSKDAAIEEVNDWAYDNFDDPLFDVAPEENCIYINTDILEKI